MSHFFISFTPGSSYKALKMTGQLGGERVERGTPLRILTSQNVLRCLGN